MAISGQNLQPFTGNGDVSKLMKNSKVECKNSKQTWKGMDTSLIKLL